MYSDKKEFYLKSVEEMVTNFSDIPQAIANTVRIAKKCSFFLEEKPPNLPKIKSDRFDENTMLRNISEQGLEKRLNLGELEGSSDSSDLFELYDLSDFWDTLEVLWLLIWN